MRRRPVLILFLVCLFAFGITAGTVIATGPPTSPNKTEVCHNPGPHQVTIEPANAAVLAAHLAHGDTLGPCPTTTTGETTTGETTTGETTTGETTTTGSSTGPSVPPPARPLPPLSPPARPRAVRPQLPPLQPKYAPGHPLYGKPAPEPIAPVAGDLPRTGVDLGLVAFVGGLLAAAGFWLRRRA